jgi:hypothetical protein
MHCLSPAMQLQHAASGGEQSREGQSSAPSSAWHGSEIVTVPIASATSWQSSALLATHTRSPATQPQQDSTSQAGPGSGTTPLVESVEFERDSSGKITGAKKRTI